MNKTLIYILTTNFYISFRLGPNFRCGCNQCRKLHKRSHHVIYK